MKTTKPFGLWPSAISANQLSQGLRLLDVQWDSSGHTLGLLSYTLLQGSKLRLSILFLIYRSLLILFILHKNIFSNLFTCRIVSGE